MSSAPGWSFSEEKPRPRIGAIFNSGKRPEVIRPTQSLREALSAMNAARRDALHVVAEDPAGREGLAHLVEHLTFRAHGPDEEPLRARRWAMGWS